jgi:hypothetical protein
MAAEPGADERRIRHWLRRRGVGLNAFGDTMATAPDDWWDRLYDKPEPDEPDGDEGEQEEAVEEHPGRFTPQPDYWPHPHMPAVLTHAPERAAAAISPKTRALPVQRQRRRRRLGPRPVPPVRRGDRRLRHHYSIGGALVLGIGGSLLIAHVWDRRTRHWWPGIAWVARIPLATAIVRARPLGARVRLTRRHRDHAVHGRRPRDQRRRRPHPRHRRRRRHRDRAHRDPRCRDP